MFGLFLISITNSILVCFIKPFLFLKIPQRFMSYFQKIAFYFQESCNIVLNHHEGSSVFLCVSMRMWCLIRNDTGNYLTVCAYEGEFRFSWWNDCPTGGCMILWSNFLDWLERRKWAEQQHPSLCILRVEAIWPIA